MSLRRGSPQQRNSPLRAGGGLSDTSLDNDDNDLEAAAAASLVQPQQQHTDMSSSTSPYLQAETFEPTVEQVQDLKASQQRWNAIVFTTGLSAFFFALCSMYTVGTTFVFLCFAFPTVLGPYVVHQRRYLNRYPTLRRLINRLRFQVNRLQVQNNKFAAENTRLEQQVTHLQQTEFQLHQLCQQQGSNLNQLQDLIRENGAVQREMHRLQDAAALHDLLQAILVSDRDMDAVLSDAEWRQLQLRLQCVSVVDEERLQQALRMVSTTRNFANEGGGTTAMIADETSSFRYHDALHPTEEDVAIVTRGALSGVDGWLV